MKRRSFLAAPVAMATMTEAFGEPAYDGWIDPTPKVNVKRTLHLEQSHKGMVLIKTDAPDKPRHLIKPEVIDSIWGRGAYEIMPQSLHWKMIDSGWFGEEDLWFPFEKNSPEYEVWFGYFQPACEAHDLISNLLGVNNFWFIDPKDVGYGLEFMLHPSTPRYATVKLEGPQWISGFKELVESKAAHLTVETEVHPQVHAREDK